MSLPTQPAPTERLGPLVAAGLGIARLLLLSSVLAGTAACRAFEESSIPAIQVGDTVRVTDEEGRRHLLTVDEVHETVIEGDGLRLEAARVRSIEVEHRSVAAFGTGVAKGIFAFVCIAGATFAFWGPLVL